VRFVKEDAKKSKLWRKYVVEDTDDNRTTMDVPDDDFPLVWTPKLVKGNNLSSNG
jgi:hypothetical protein